MRKFKVLLKGKNIWTRLEGKVVAMGFYVTRFIEAPDSQSAGLQAVGLMLRDSKLQEIALNDPDDPPIVSAEEVEELESFDHLENLTPGICFYEEKQSRLV